jgi:Nuclease-related domain
VAAGSAAQSESERSRQRANDLRRQADRLDQRADAFEKGRVGELAISAALARLVPAGYALIDDVRWPGTQKANVDHVVYGPAGMFVVDAKNWTGTVEVRAGVLRQNGYRRTRETDKAASMAASVQAFLGPSVGAVNPVLCLVGQPLTPAQMCGATLVVGADGLAPWIFRQREIWPAYHVAALTAWLPAVLQPASPGSPSVVIATSPTSAEPLSPSYEPGAGAGQGGRHRGSGDMGLYGWLRGR